MRTGFADVEAEVAELKACGVLFEEFAAGRICCRLPAVTPV
jgi:hypothetical protein